MSKRTTIERRVDQFARTIDLQIMQLGLAEETPEERFERRINQIAGGKYTPIETMERRIAQIAGMDTWVTLWPRRG